MRWKYEWQLIGFGKYKPTQNEIKGPRPDGYYWIRYQGKWQIAEWFNGQWVFLGDIGLMNDRHFDKIHEEPIEQPPYD